MAKVKSKFVNAVEINGKMVSFFSPPHDEPDFFWVDIYELANAFLSNDAAQTLVNHAQNFDRTNRAAETAAHNGRIVTVISHPLAHGLCGAIDGWNGHTDALEGEWGGGPAFLAYSVAAADIMRGHYGGGFSELMAAFKNQGGPSMQGMREADNA